MEAGSDVDLQDREGEAGAWAGGVKREAWCETRDLVLMRGSAGRFVLHRSRALYDLSTYMT